MSWSNRKVTRRFPPPPLENPVVMAISNGDTQHLLYLLSVGADPDALHGDTCPMVFATHRDEPETISTLLAHNADINSVDAKGMTALMIAASYHRQHILTQLIARHADVNRQDNNGNTALMHALFKKDQAAIIALVLAGADTGIPNRSGDTAMTYLNKTENTYLNDMLDDARAEHAHTLTKNISVRKPLKIRPK